MASEGSSTADSRFEALPQEMVVLVLERLASPEDLASIIRASPSALAALQCQRRSILTQVLRNSPLVLHELLGILNCPAFDPPLDDYKDDRKTTWKKKVDNFETRYWALDSTRTIRISFDFPTDLATINTIYRMRAMITSLISDYMGFVACISKPGKPEPKLYAPDKSRLSKLTSAEQERLLVAFLRYELVCRLYFQPYLIEGSPSRSPPARYHGHGWDLLRLLPAWGLEAVCHVHDYVQAKLNLVFREMDQDFSRVVVDIIRKEPPPAPGTASYIQRDSLETVARGPRFFSHKARGDDPGDDYPKHGWIALYVTNLAKFGLGFLHDFLNQDRDSRRKFITHTFDTLAPVTYTGFPDFSYSSMEYNDFEEFDDSFDETGGSVAWGELVVWVGSYDYVDTIDPDNMGKLRPLGWSFWDRKRLIRLGIIWASKNWTEPEFRRDLRRQVHYGHPRNSPGLPPFTVSKESWHKEIVPRFYTASSVDAREFYEQIGRRLAAGQPII